ncbi:hypothetical protein [Pseudovibrio sp. Ad37]|uniref:hypothetical protein n=1 Tax=Pseudovibrio sp. Ad37 TaxID=989422 RepID=UPI0007AEC592|nr:hypothetical protein [Pseudovibrio sp. Ad37]KZL15331.1 hypothetical protein PsAD37_04340 [Pseudovibrio sp. Ad37]
MRLLLGLLFVIFSLSLANAEEPTKEALLEELFQLTESTDEAILERAAPDLIQVSHFNFL